MKRNCSRQRTAIRYAESRGAVEFEPTDSASGKALYAYRLLVQDKIIAPMSENQVGQKTIRHRLALGYAHLPVGHSLFMIHFGWRFVAWQSLSLV